MCLIFRLCDYIKYNSVASVWAFALPAILEVSRYIKKYRDITPISIISVLYRIGALDISFFPYINIMLVTSEMSVILSLFFRLFNVNLKTNEQ